MGNEKTIYIVIGGEYEDQYICDVYDKKENADLAAKIEDFNSINVTLQDHAHVVEAILKTEPPATVHTYLVEGHMKGYIVGRTLKHREFNLTLCLDDEIKLDDGVEMGEPEFEKERGFVCNDEWIFRVHVNVRYDINEDIEVFKKRLQARLRDKFRVWIRS